MSDLHIPDGGGETVTSVTPVEEPPAPAFSRIGTILSAVVFLGGLAFMTWLQISVPRPERVAEPERALSLMVGRVMDLEAAMATLPAWERVLYEGTASSGLNELEEPIAWYRELHAWYQSRERDGERQRIEPVQVELELAVLEGEAGYAEEMRNRIESWRKRQAPYPALADLISAAYVEPVISPDVAHELHGVLAEVLPAGWFYERLAMRLASRSGDTQLASASRAAQETRSRILLKRVRLLSWTELVVILSGLAVMPALWRHLRAGTKTGNNPAAIPPPWQARTGLLVLLRGGAAAIVVTIGFLFAAQTGLLDFEEPDVRLISMPLASLPLFLLAANYLLAPAGLDFLNGFGLRLISSGWTRVGLAALVILGAGFLGEWILGVAAEAFDFSSHWTEWFDADLAWGDPATVAVTIVEFVVFAPVVEEVAFRGIFFATLRRRLNFLQAAMLSAGVFALAHGYGLLGFASVLLSGVLWAWVYERTGSLWPGILAHALNNLLVCLTILYLLRL